MANTTIKTSQIRDAAITAAKLAVTLDQISSPVASVDMNSQKLVNLAAGTTAGDSIRFEQIGDLGFLDTINSSSLLDDGVVTEVKLSAGVQTKLNANSAQNNTSAIIAPTVDNDSSEGYSVNSYWLDIVHDEAYRCFDATIGAAIWVKTTLTIDELGALAVLNTVGTTQIDNSAVTYAKIQNVSATDKLLGRSSSGAGVVEEIACTAFGRSLIDDADAAAGRTTLGLVIGTNVQAYDAELAAMQKKAEKLGLAGRVRFWGPQKDVRPFYGAADIFALPTLYDPFPNAALEALACGLPLITTTTCGAAELVTVANGLVVAAHHPESLAVAISTLCKTGRAAAMQAAARASVNTLDLARMAEKLTALYTRILQEKAAH